MTIMRTGNSRKLLFGLALLCGVMSACSHAPLADNGGMRTERVQIEVVGEGAAQSKGTPATKQDTACTAAYFVGIRQIMDVLAGLGDPHAVKEVKTTPDSPQSVTSYAGKFGAFGVTGKTVVNGKGMIGSDVITVEYSARYTVKDNVLSSVPAQYAKIYDSPRAIAGFDVKNVRYDAEKQMCSLDMTYVTKPLPIRDLAPLAASTSAKLKPITIPDGFDGLIIDAKDSNFRPSLINRIYSTSGQLVYNPKQIDQKILVEEGCAEFTNSVENAESALFYRGVLHPLVLKAVAAINNGADIQVDDADAQRILSADQAARFLREAKVGVVLK